MGLTKFAVISLLLLSAGTACKKARSPNSAQPAGSPAGRDTGNSPIVEGSDGDSTSAGSDAEADAIHAAILSELRSKHSGGENQTWFESRAKIEGDWVADSPKNYWSKAAGDLPAGYACTKGDVGCDPQFERRLCSADKDCEATHTQCVVLQASINKVGATPKSMCLGSGDILMDDYYAVIVKAQKHLEISSLTVPSGRFRKTLVNALAVLSQRETPPTIRMIFSSLDGATPNIINPPGKVLDAIEKEITEVGGDPGKLKINFAFLSDKKVSWNHAKIVLADANYLIQGGHNFLDPDYVKEQPIFDLSMHASGSVGIGVQNFINALWTKAGPFASNMKDSEHIVPPALEDVKEGDVKVIGMGRMGSFGDLASDDGMAALVKAAKKSLYFAQQDMFNDILQTGKPESSHALPQLVDAILRGVKVRVAQSSSTVFLGYGMVEPSVAHGLITDAVLKEAEARKFVPPDNLTIKEYLCTQLEYAPFLFTAAVTKWPNGDAIGVHPKLIIADESSFYMGSQNFYPSDLQEFGLLISNKKVTADLLDKYWNKIWEQSSQKKVACRK